MIDEWCPITRDFRELACQFEKKAIPAIRRLDVPSEWYKAVELYDALVIDYHKLFKLRGPKKGFEVVPLQLVVQAQEGKPSITSNEHA